MGAVLAILEAILGNLLRSIALTLATTTAVQELQKLFGGQTNAISYLELSSDVVDTTVAIFDPTHGLSALYDQAAADTAAIILAIEHLTDGTTPVSLPPTAPSGYGGLDGNATFSAVWQGTHFGDAVTPYVYLKYGGIVDYSLGGTTGYRPDGGLFAYFYVPIDSAGVHPTFYPSSDFATILPDDDLLTWLTRINPTASTGWWSGPSSWVYVTGNSGDGNATFLTVIQDSDFQAIKRDLGLTTIVGSAPVWPGIDLVTLGSDTAISAQMTVEGPMHGIIVLISDVTVNKPNYNYDTRNAWKFIGSLAFENDNGDVEEFQLLGFNDALYCPRSMSAAARVVIRADPSVVGTVTPWVID